MKEIVEVAIGLPVFKTFHYRIPEKMRDSLQIGMRVLVPFKGRKVTGFSVDLLKSPQKKLKKKYERSRISSMRPLSSILQCSAFITGFRLLPLSIRRSY